MGGSKCRGGGKYCEGIHLERRHSVWNRAVSTQGVNLDACCKRVLVGFERATRLAELGHSSHPGYHSQRNHMVFQTFRRCFEAKEAFNDRICKKLLAQRLSAPSCIRLLNRVQQSVFIISLYSLFSAFVLIYHYKFLINLIYLIYFFSDQNLFFAICSYHFNYQFTDFIFFILRFYVLQNIKIPRKNINFKNFIINL